MNKIAIMQPYLFPYLGYFQLINYVDTFVFFNDVTFIKKHYVNRNIILVNGDQFQFTLPLHKASQNKKINEIEITGNFRMLKTIQYSYAKYPNFDQVMPMLEEIFRYDSDMLDRFVANSTIKISRYLDMTTDFMFSSDIEKDNSLKGQDKIIQMCKILKADEYINPSGGKDLYNKSVFKKNKIKLKFLSMKFGLSFMSVVHILMDNSKDEVKNMIAECEVS